jgi:uncharacterized repeat protein (TIGR01451 family)
VPIEKTADSPTVTAGGRAGYQITVRNRGRLPARNLRACDRIPRGMTFVSADRKLRRVGRARCLVIPLLRPGQRVSVHLVLQVNANASPGTLTTNTGDITPLPPASPPPASEPGTPPAPGTPAVPPAVIAKPKPIARDVASVRIVKAAKREKVERASRRPRFTG